MDRQKKIPLNEMSYFPKPYTGSKNKIKVELNLSIYVTKSDLKKAAGAETSDFAKKVDLASLKSDVEKLNVDELVQGPSSLNSFKRKVDTLDVDEFKSIPLTLKK